MEKIVTLEQALKRITELEKENAILREELEYYKNRKLSGRQKHNEKWMAIYHDFVAGYESGMTMVEIAKRNNVSERTIYRYKAYYEKMKKAEEQTILLTPVKQLHWEVVLIVKQTITCLPVMPVILSLKMETPVKNRLLLRKVTLRFKPENRN